MSDKEIEVIGSTLEACDGADYDDVAKAILRTLKAARIAVVELPESQPSGIIGQIEWPVESRDGHSAVTIRHNGLIGNSGVSNPYLTPDHARSHAAALLAAAEAVQS